MMRARSPNSANERRPTVSPSNHELSTAFFLRRSAWARIFSGTPSSHQFAPCFCSSRSRTTSRTEVSKQWTSAYTRHICNALLRRSTGNGLRTCSRSVNSASRRSAPSLMPALRNFSASASKVIARNSQSRRVAGLVDKQMLPQGFEDGVVDLNIFGRRQVDLDIVSKSQRARLRQCFGRRRR